MAEDPLSLSDQSQNWKTRVTVSLWGMKQASSAKGAVGQSENRGLKTEECIRHSLYVCIKLYRKGQHYLFLCERIGCTIKHKKPSVQARDQQIFIGEGAGKGAGAVVGEAGRGPGVGARGRGSAPDIMYNLCLILNIVFIKIIPYT